MMGNFFEWAFSHEAPGWVVYLTFVSSIIFTISVILASLFLASLGYWIVPIVTLFVLPLGLSYSAYRAARKGGEQ